MVTDRVAFITGSGRGIGKALAVGFAREGYRVVIGSPTTSRNEAVAAEITSQGGEALPVSLDVADEESIGAAVAEALRRFNRIDVLVNNAALKPGFLPGDHRHVRDLPPDVFRRMLAVNVTGTFLCSQACAPSMMDRGAGSIVNVTSAAATTYRESESFYGATKAALNAMTKILALQLKPSNIAVNAILPGYTLTEDTNTAALSPQQRATILRTEASLPLALYLAQQDPVEVSGEIIDVVEWNQAHGLGAREAWVLGG